MVVVHGGPGGAGETAPVARELCGRFGVLEPYQTRKTVQGQVDELKAALESLARIPVILIGYSWGAWLCVILTAMHPALVKKLILVSSGPIEARYAENIAKTRMARLTKTERKEVAQLEKKLGRPEFPEKAAAFARVGQLMSRADAYDPMELPDDIEYRPDIFERIWPEAAELRRSGKLLDLAARVNRPVCAIHGDYDPHPAEGVEKPLSNALKQFRFVLLEQCGHKPWAERKARRLFFEVLHEEIVSSF